MTRAGRNEKVAPLAAASRAQAIQRELEKKFSNPNRWKGYVFEAYLNHTEGAVYLAGLPDVASSRPHSRENEG